jgi:uncharacterized protein YkwD
MSFVVKSFTFLFLMAGSFASTSHVTIQSHKHVAPPQRFTDAARPASPSVADDGLILRAFRPHPGSDDPAPTTDAAQPSQDSTTQPDVAPAPAVAETAAPPPAPAPAVVRAVAPPPPPAPAPQPPPLVIGSAQQALINQDRAASGLAPLNWSPCLAGIAYQSALRMANQGFISHGGGVQQDWGCSLGSAQTGENVGEWGGGINDPAINQLFIASAPHRANILGPYHYVGTAWVVTGGKGYIAIEFA